MKKIELAPRPKIVTDLFNYKSKEMYINMDKKLVPKKPIDPNKYDKDFDDFYDWEEEKCKRGVTINGVHINGSLYYFLNWHTLVEEMMDEYGRVNYVSGNSQLWDNVWKLFTEYEASQTATVKETFMVGGSRQIGKTTMIAGLACRELFVYEKSEVLGLFATKPFKQSFTKKLQQASYDKNNIFLKEPLVKDFSQENIKFGLKYKDNEPEIFSQMFLYLTEGGNNSAVGVGKSVTFYFYDEIATYPCKAAHEAILPALRGRFGLRTSPFLCFTGGEAIAAAEAKNMFLNPEANNIKIYRNGNRDTGYFMDATHRQDFKYKTTLAKYLDVKTPSELDEIVIHVSDTELALKTLEAEIKKAEQDTDGRTAMLKRIYDPLTVEDMFMKDGTNPFSYFLKDLEKHKSFLETNKVGRNIEVSIVGGVASWRDTEKRAINYFPKKDFENTDAAMVMYEPPRENNTYFLHAGGLDPYNTSQSETSPSLGSFYLMRRRNPDLSDSYQDTMVLSYCARTARMPDFLNNIKAVLMLYNATMLHERSNDIVLQHFDVNNEASKYLCESWNLAHEINPQSESKTGYGLAATPKNKDYCISQIVEYLGEVIDIVDDKPVLGLTRILDPLLIEEFLQYGEGNFDRVLGFGHAVAYCKYLDKYYKVQEEPEYKTTTKKHATKSTPFGFGGKSPWNIGK